MYSANFYLYYRNVIFHLMFISYVYFIARKRPRPAEVDKKKKVFVEKDKKCEF